MTHKHIFIVLWHECVPGKKRNKDIYWWIVWGYRIQLLLIGTNTNQTDNNDNNYSINHKNFATQVHAGCSKGSRPEEIGEAEWRSTVTEVPWDQQPRVSCQLQSRALESPEHINIHTSHTHKSHTHTHTHAHTYTQLNHSDFMTVLQTQ